MDGECQPHVDKTQPQADEADAWPSFVKIRIWGCDDLSGLEYQWSSRAQYEGLHRLAEHETHWILDVACQDLLEGTMSHPARRRHFYIFSQVMGNTSAMQQANRLTKSDARRCLPAWKERMTAVQQGHGSASTFHCISHHRCRDAETKTLQMHAFMCWFSKLGSCKIGRIEVFLCKTSLILWVSSFRCLCRCSDKDMKLSLKIKLLLSENAFLKAFHLPHFQATLCCFNRSTLHLKCQTQRTHHIGMIFWEILASAPAGSSLFRALWWCKRNQRMLCSHWRLTLSTLHASQQNHLSSAQWDQVPRTQTPACDTCAHCASQSFTVWHELQCLHLAAPWTQVEANHPVISLRKDSTWPFSNIPCIQSFTLQALFGFLSYQTLPGWHDNFDGFRHPSDEALVANGTRGLGSTFIVSRSRWNIRLKIF